MHCNARSACTAQGLLRVTTQMHPRQKITVLPAVSDSRPGVDIGKLVDA